MFGGNLFIQITFIVKKLLILFLTNVETAFPFLQDSYSLSFLALEWWKLESLPYYSPALHRAILYLPYKYEQTSPQSREKHFVFPNHKCPSTILSIARKTCCSPKHDNHTTVTHDVFSAEVPPRISYFFTLKYFCLHCKNPLFHNLAL